MTRTIDIKEQDYRKLEAEANKQNKTVSQYVEELVIKMQQNTIETEETTEMEYEEVTVKIPKPFYDALLTYLNKHPYYADFEEFVLEALREYNLERIMFQEMIENRTFTVNPGEYVQKKA